MMTSTAAEQSSKVVWAFQAVQDDQIVLGSSEDQTDPQTLHIPLQAVIVKLQDATRPHVQRLLYVQTSQDKSEAVPQVLQAWASNLPEDLNYRGHAFDQALFKDVEAHTERPVLEVVVSTGSGMNQAKQFYEAALRPLLAVLQESTDLEINIHETTSADSIIELARNEWRSRLLNKEHVYIILLSGDGGAVDAVNGLQLWHHDAPAKRKPTLITLPLGSGNALFSSYSYHLRDDTWGLSTLLRGSIRNLPSFRVQFSPGARLVVDEGRGEQDLAQEDDRPTLHGVVVCSWGLHATLVADSDTAEYRKHGAKRFGMVAAKLLQPEDGSLPHVYTGQVEFKIEDNEWQSLGEGGSSYILATLVSNLERTFMISPDSVAQDGSLRLVTIKPLPGDKIMQIMGAAYDSGKHVKLDGVGYRRIRGLRIHLAEEDANWRRVCIDGKIVRMEREGWLQLDMDEDSGIGYLCGPSASLDAL